MAINKKHPLIVKAMKFASEIAVDTNAPFFGMVESFALAWADKAMGEKPSRDDFVALIQSLRSHAKVATLAENKLSETWSTVELGQYACVKPLFKAMRSLPTLPSMTGLYDIACSIRGKSSFAKDGMNHDTALAQKWDAKRADAPTAAQLTAAMKAANVARNKTKLSGGGSFKDYVASVLKRLQKEQKGYTVKRDGKDVAIPANTSPLLVQTIAQVTLLNNSFVAAEQAAAAKGNGKRNGKRAAQ